MAFVDPLRKDIYIVCAAIWYDAEKKDMTHLPHNIKTGIVVCGYRHGNCFELLGTMFPGREYINKCVQGFLTSNNLFVNRVHAAKIAADAGQCELVDSLNSECIYSSNRFEKINPDYIHDSQKEE